MPDSSGESGAVPGRRLPPASAPSFTWCKAPCSDCRAVRGGGTVRLLLAQSRHGLRCCISKVNPSKTQKTFWVLRRASRPSGLSVCGLLREQDAPEREPLSPGMQWSGVCFPAPSGPPRRRHRQLSVVICQPPMRPHRSAQCPCLWTTRPEGGDGSKRRTGSRLGMCPGYFPPLLDFGELFPCCLWACWQLDCGTEGDAVDGHL